MTVLLAWFLGAAAALLVTLTPMVAVAACRATGLPTARSANGENGEAMPVSERALDAGELRAFFDTLIPGQLATDHIAGAVVAVVQDGQLLYAQGYGYADVAQQTSVVADRTLFNIGSAGKLFTWTAVMQLVEQG